MQPDVLEERRVAQARIVVGLHQRAGGRRVRIVRHDDLKVRDGLGQDALEGVLEVPVALVGRDGDGTSVMPLDPPPLAEDAGAA